MNLREHWKHFPHQVDVGVRRIEPTNAAALFQTGLALTYPIPEPSKLHSIAGVRIDCTATDDKLPLVDWLNAVMLGTATSRMLFGRFDVHLTPGRLETIALRRISRDRPPPACNRIERRALYGAACSSNRQRQLGGAMRRRCVNHQTKDHGPIIQTNRNPPASTGADPEGD